jgi:hypothetical protein
LALTFEKVLELKKKKEEKKLFLTTAAAPFWWRSKNDILKWEPGPCIFKCSWPL